MNLDHFIGQMMVWVGIALIELGIYHHSLDLVCWGILVIFVAFAIIL